MKSAATPIGAERGARASSAAVRLGLILYGAFCYGVMALSFVFFAAWISNAPIPVTIDSGGAGPLASSLLWNSGLLIGFCLLHSAAARTRVKRVTRRWVPFSLERASYCLVFSLLLIALCLAWQPLPQPVWRVDGSVPAAGLHALFALSWGIHFLGIALIGHNEFFGLRQIGFAVRGEPYRPLPAETRRRYVLARVPLVLGLAMIPWATPTMSLGRFCFAVVATIYCAVGAYWSDRDAGGPPGAA